MPKPYKPKAPTTGTDDYRCFLLDPHLADPAFVTGIDVVPGRRRSRAPRDPVPGRPRRGRRGEGPGRRRRGPGLDLLRRSRPELAKPRTTPSRARRGWAPGRREAARGSWPRTSASRSRPAAASSCRSTTTCSRAAIPTPAARGSVWRRARRTSLRWRRCSCPRRSSSPAARGKSGPLCDRAAAVRDVSARFGGQSGLMVAGLQFLCGGDPDDPKASPVQTCDRTMRDRGHGPGGRRAHAPPRPVDLRDPQPRHADANASCSTSRSGTSTTRGRGRSRKPAKIRPGDVLRVTCRHDQALRDVVPELEDAPERYVVWGEGTTDEMCLGIVMVTQPEEK